MRAFVVFGESWDHYRDHFSKVPLSRLLADSKDQHQRFSCSGLLSGSAPARFLVELGELVNLPRRFADPGRRWSWIASERLHAQ